MRFSLRDIFWLTVVVALIAGWGVDRHRLARLSREVDVWRHCTGALEHFVRTRDYSVTWTADRSTVELSTGEVFIGVTTLPIADYEPGAPGQELKPFPLN